MSQKPYFPELHLIEAALIYVDKLIQGHGQQDGYNMRLARESERSKKNV